MFDKQDSDTLSFQQTLNMKTFFLHEIALAIERGEKIPCRQEVKWSAILAFTLREQYNIGWTFFITME